MESMEQFIGTQAVSARHAFDTAALELHPAIQHVDELQLAVVPVPLAVRRLARAGADDVRHHPALGRLLDAEVAVLEVASQAALFEARAFQMTDRYGSHGGELMVKTLRILR